MRACFAALVLGATAIAAGAQAPPAADAGVRGYVLTHEDAPVTSGTVVLEGPERSSAVNATIDREGRFHAVVGTRGLHRLSINVPGFAPHRVNVDVPTSHTISLPAIRLIAPSYLRARFVNAAGDVILSPRLRRRFQNGDRMSMFATDDQGPARLESDSSITLGPLGRGLHTLMVDMPGMALTALKPITVTGDESLIDAGTIVIQPGTVVHVDLVDGSGAPLANRRVSIEDVASDSPLSPYGVATDQQGRATFTRLAAGRYRVITSAVERCNAVYLLASRLVAVNGTGEAKLSITLGGTVRLRFVTPFGALPGAPVSIVSDAGQPDGVRIPVPGRPPIAYISSGCQGSTDPAGRVTFTDVPPGPVRIDVRASGSTHQLRTNVSGDGPEMTYAIPDGFLQFQITNESNGRPVGNATVTWNGAGRRVRSPTNGDGAALLEGLGDGTGSVSVTAMGFAPAEMKIIAGVASTYEVALKPEPPTERRIRIVGLDGKPVPRAIVELLPPTVLDILTFVVAGVDGEIRYFNAPPGTLSAIASADGFAPTSFSLPAANDAPVVVTLTVAR